MTLNEIEQRLSELKEEQDKLAAELERLKAEQAQVKPWRAEEKSGFYLLDDEGRVVYKADFKVPKDDTRYSIGNYYRTRELAEQDAKELALRGRVRQLRDALCEGYQFIPFRLNYIIQYCHSSNKYYVSFEETTSSIAEIYFDTKDHAQTAGDILNAQMRESKI